MTSMMELAELAINAEPINDDDWGSETQIDAENAFYDALAEVGVDMTEYEARIYKGDLSDRLRIGLAMAEEAMTQVQ